MSNVKYNGTIYGTDQASEVRYGNSNVADALLNVETNLNDVAYIGDSATGVIPNDPAVLNTIDVAFPIVHGTNCEDGTIAGFVTLLGIPFVGPDILASSIGMDKIIQKKVLRQSGIPVVDFVAFYSVEYIKDEEKILKDVEDKLNYPVIVKPGNLGSSVGIKTAHDKTELLEAIKQAKSYDNSVIIEEKLTNFTEYNIACFSYKGILNLSQIEEVKSTSWDAMF